MGDDNYGSFIIQKIVFKPCNRCHIKVVGRLVEHDNVRLGYQKSASIAKESLKSGKTVAELLLEKKLFTKEQLEKILDPYAMTMPATDDTGSAIYLKAAEA